MSLTLKPKHPFTSVSIMPDVALPLLKEIELLRIEARKTKAEEFSSDATYVTACLLVVTKHTDDADLLFHLNEFRDKSAAGYYRGSVVDWYFRSAQAIVANAAGFPGRAEWSSILHNTMGVPAVI